MIYTHILPTQLMRTCTDGLLYCASKWAYDVSGGLFWTAALFGFCMVMFIATIQFGTTRAFGFASMVGLLGSMFFATLQLMPWWTATVFIISGVIGLTGMVMQGR